MYRKKRLCLQIAKKRADDRNYMETLLLDDFNLTLTEKKNVPELCHELPAFWPVFIHLEFVERVKDLQLSFGVKSLFMSTILPDVKHGSLQARNLFADALYCIYILKKQVAW